MARRRCVSTAYASSFSQGTPVDSSSARVVVEEAKGIRLGSRFSQPSFSVCEGNWIVFLKKEILNSIVEKIAQHVVLLWKWYFICLSFYSETSNNVAFDRSYQNIRVQFYCTIVLKYKWRPFLQNVQYKYNVISILKSINPYLYQSIFTSFGLSSTQLALPVDLSRDLSLDL